MTTDTRSVEITPKDVEAAMGHEPTSMRLQLIAAYRVVEELTAENASLKDKQCQCGDTALENED